MREFDDAQDSSTPAESADDGCAATQLIQTDQNCSRQQSDVALAAELLKSGYVNERELLTAVSDWSIHGIVALGQHLIDKKILTREQVDRLQTTAQERLERDRDSIAGADDAPHSDRSMLLATLERVDGSGRVAKLLGVTVAARGGEQDSRVMQGRYELIRKIGQGGLGKVWLARDINLNRYVALKEISQKCAADDPVIQRFRNEAEITGRLDHPSIVPIYLLGEDIETGRVFYTMRFLGRSTLQDSIAEYHERREDGDDDPMLLRRLLTSFVNVCHACGHAHSRKVIHRDLKPENVVIDSFGQVIVIDWGLAKVVDETAVECLMDSMGIDQTDQTADGEVLGTPLYMAPEQAAGRLDELDHRTDIYGLGAILFSIVTGSAPHESTQKAAVESGAGARGMISAIAGGDTPSAAELHPDVDPALEAICNKAMARRRYARYQAATDLAEDVQRWMAGEPVTAYQETRWQRLNRWVARHQRISQLILAAAIVGIVALTTLAMSARQNHQAAVHARFSRLNGDVGEVAIQLEGVASELAKDARFLTAMPSVQGIIDAAEGVEDEDGSLWRERLQEVLMGMLRANPEYLAISLEEMSEGSTRDIVRVERSPADPTLVRSVPEIRLLQMDSVDELMTAVSTLRQGDVKMSLDPRARYANPLHGRNLLVVATPVFSNTTGEFFGMVAIELNLAERIRHVIEEQGTFDGEFFVADGDGQLMVSAIRDEPPQVYSETETIPNLPDEVQNRMSKAKQSFEVSKEDEYIAQRLFVDPNGRGVLIFARLLDDE